MWNNANANQKGVEKTNLDCIIMPTKGIVNYTGKETRCCFLCMLCMKKGCLLLF